MIRTHTCEQFLNLRVDLGLDFVFFACLFRFIIYVLFVLAYISLFIVLLAFVVLGLVSSVQSQAFGCKELICNDVFCVQSNVKP